MINRLNSIPVRLKFHRRKENLLHLAFKIGYNPIIINRIKYLFCNSYNKEKNNNTNKTHLEKQNKTIYVYRTLLNSIEQ